jgi:hypothetical protein
MVTISVCVLVGMLLITPATAHFTTNTKHLAKHAWQQFIKQKVYTKKQADNRFASKDAHRVAQISATASQAVNGVNQQILAPVSITVPDGVNFVRVTGTSTFAGGSVFVALFWQMDGACTTSGVGYTNRQFGHTGPGQDSVTEDFVVAVTPGTYTFRLCAETSGATNAFQRALVVETVARGATGGSTLAVASKDNSASAPSRPGRPD